MLYGTNDIVGPFAVTNKKNHFLIFFLGPCPIPLKDRLVQYSSRLLGVPRMRILRVTNQSCPIATEFKEAIKVKLIIII